MSVKVAFRTSKTVEPSAARAGCRQPEKEPECRSSSANTQMRLLRVFVEEVDDVG